VLAPADTVVVVTNPEVSAVRDADRIIGLIEAEQKGPARLIINRLNTSMTRRGDMLSPDDILELLAVELLGIIPEDEVVLTSSNRGQPVALDKKSRASQAFHNIARRLNGETVPLMNLESNDGFLRRLTRMIRPAGGD
jgi:septum site-determining protein MinD